MPLESWRALSPDLDPQTHTWASNGVTVTYPPSHPHSNLPMFTSLVGGRSDLRRHALAFLMTGEYGDMFHLPIHPSRPGHWAAATLWLC